jgi:hypothetical protein
VYAWDPLQPQIPTTIIPSVASFSSAWCRARQQTSLASPSATALVQVSRTPAFRATRRWLSVASEKRQGTKSREVRQVGAASPYGDCAFAVLEGMSGSGIGGGFSGWRRMIDGQDWLSAAVTAGPGWARVHSKASDHAADPAYPRGSLSALRLAVGRSAS